MSLPVVMVWRYDRVYLQTQLELDRFSEKGSKVIYDGSPATRKLPGLEYFPVAPYCGI
jgi:hypothetical protein